MKALFILYDYSLHNHIVEEYQEARPEDSISLMKVGFVLRGKSRAETVFRILPKLSKRFIWERYLEFLVLVLISFFPKLIGRGARFHRLATIARRKKIPFWCGDDVMSADAIAFVKEQKPDVIISCFHQILRKELLDIPPLGVINIHPGILPEFRGIQPYFWELFTEHGEAGATLHFIRDELVDTGEIIAQARYKTWPKMSVQLNYYLSINAASQLLPRVIEHLERGNLSPLPQTPEQGNYYRWPDSVSVERLRACGHKIVGWKDLKEILQGDWDSFFPESTKVFVKTKT